MLLRKRFPKSRFIEHFAAEYFALTMSYCSYLIGNLSIATGVVIAGAPVCAFILFNRQVVLWAFAVSLTAQTVISFGWPRRMAGLCPDGAAYGGGGWLRERLLADPNVLFHRTAPGVIGGRCLLHIEVLAQARGVGDSNEPDRCAHPAQ